MEKKGASPVRREAQLGRLAGHDVGAQAKSGKLKP
jgi:hypothetical protein